MNNKISAIQPNNLFRVNAINLFENRNQNSNNYMNSGLFSQQSNGEYNLTHPKANNDIRARNLDLLA